MIICMIICIIEKKCKNAMTNFLSPILNVALEGRLSLMTVNGQVIIILRFNLYTPPPPFILRLDL